MATNLSFVCCDLPFRAHPTRVVLLFDWAGLVSGASVMEDMRRSVWLFIYRWIDQDNESFDWASSVAN